MIKALTLTNFMAHAHTVLTFAPGLNVLCGPNNSGKSAVVEALRCLVSNRAPRHVIRHGAAEARVEALLDSGHTVRWIRRKSYSLYETQAPGAAEHEVFAKLGKSGVPAEVEALLKLSPVSFEKNLEVDVHLGDQRHPIFLLDQPGSVLADFLASSTESAHLMAMQDLLRDKVRTARKTIKTLEDTLAGDEAGLDRLAGLPDVSLELERLSARGRELAASARAVPLLEDHLGRVRDLEERISRLGSRSAALAAVLPPPALEPSAGLASSLGALDTALSKERGARMAVSALEPLASPPELQPSGDLARDAGLLARASRLRQGAYARVDALAALAPPPDCPDPGPLAEIIGRMAEVAARVDKGRVWMEKRDRELADMASAIARRLEEVGECPLCGSSLDADKFLQKAASRGTAEN